MCGLWKECGLEYKKWLINWICGKESVCVCVGVGVGVGCMRSMRSKKEVNVYICKRENKKKE